MSRRILVSGASIAGNTVAWVLARGGAEVTVVERAPAFRGGGQNIDVRDVGREVVRRMGLEQAVLDHGTGKRARRGSTRTATRPRRSAWIPTRATRTTARRPRWRSCAVTSHA